MFTFFRKYNKIILAIGGSILMVIFLLPSAASQLFQSNVNLSQGTIQGEEVTVQDIRNADYEVDLLRAIGLMNPAYIQLDQNNTSLCWLMMVKEARQQGLYGSSAISDKLLRDIGLTGTRLAQIKNERKISTEYIKQAISHRQMVRALQNNVLGSRRVSEPQLRHFARDTRSKVSVRVLPITGELLAKAKDIKTPSDNAISRQYDQYKVQLAGSSKPFGFGYRLPARVKMEYIAFPRERIKKAIKVNEVDAYDYYTQNTDEFIPVEEEPVPGTEPTDKPKPEAKPKPYEQVRQEIMDKLADQKTSQIQQKMIRWALGLIHEQEMKWPKDSSSFYNPSPTTIPYDLEKLAKQIQNNQTEFGVSILPDVVRLEDKWLDLTNDLPKLEGIGGAGLVYDRNKQPMALASYISATRELLNTPNAVALQLKLQTKVISKWVIDQDRNVYLFRITAADRSRVPTSIDEAGVRDKVIADVKKLQTYNQAKDKAADYLASAREVGLDELAKKLGDDFKVEEIDQISRRWAIQAGIFSREPMLIVPMLPVVGQSEQFVDAMVEQSSKVLDAGGIDQAGPAVYTTVALEDKLAVYVVQITDVQPLTLEEYNENKVAFAGQIEQFDRVRTLKSANPFSFKELSKRMGYIRPETQKKPDPESDEKSKSESKSEPASDEKQN